MSEGPIVASDCPTVVKEGTLHFAKINRDFSHSLNFQTKTKTRVKTTTKQHLHAVTTPKWINPTQILNRLKTSLITSPNPTSSNILQNSCSYLKIPHHIYLPEHPKWITTVKHHGTKHLGCLSTECQWPLHKV